MTETRSRAGPSEGGEDDVDGMGGPCGPGRDGGCAGALGVHREEIVIQCHDASVDDANVQGDAGLEDAGPVDAGVVMVDGGFDGGAVMDSGVDGGGMDGGAVVDSGVDGGGMDAGGVVAMPVVAWQDGAGGDQEIYLRRWNGTAWEELDGSASGGGVSNTPIGASPSASPRRRRSRSGRTAAPSSRGSSASRRATSKCTSGAGTAARGKQSAAPRRAVA